MEMFGPTVCLFYTSLLYNEQYSYFSLSYTFRSSVYDSPIRVVDVGKM